MSIRSGLVLATAFTFAACGNKYPRQCDVQGEVTYARVAPVFTQYCTQCHAETNAGGDRQGAPADLNFDTYDSAAQNAEDANAALLAGDMPADDPGSVPDEQACLIEAWIDQGLREE